MNERSGPDERLSVSRFVLSTHFPRSLSILPLFLFVIVTLFQPTLMDRLHTLIADFFWLENQLWPMVQQVSWWWVTANFYLSVRAREVEKERRKEREKRRGRGRVGEREGARGVQRAGGSLLVHPGKTRPHRRPLYVDSTRCLVSPIFFSFSLSLFSIRTRRPL